MIKTKLPLLEKEIDGDGKLVVNEYEAMQVREVFYVQNHEGLE